MQVQWFLYLFTGPSSPQLSIEHSHVKPERLPHYISLLSCDLTGEVQGIWISKPVRMFDAIKSTDLLHFEELQVGDRYKEGKQG